MTRASTTRKRKRVGVDSPWPGRRRFLVAMLPFTAWGSLTAPLAEADKKKLQQAFALVAGTVFRDTGFTLPGAEVTLAPAPPEKPGEKPPVKIKPMKIVSDPRGEFAFRVPAVPMRYNVSVKAAGFRAQQKTVSVSGDERIDVFFRLEAESKK